MPHDDSRQPTEHGLRACRPAGDRGLRILTVTSHLRSSRSVGYALSERLCRGS
jgi:hypothetical protein